jgi:hypothetical protein
VFSYGIVEIEETRIGFMLWGEIERNSLGLNMWNVLYAKKGSMESRHFLQILKNLLKDVKH